MIGSWSGESLERKRLGQEAGVEEVKGDRVGG